MNQKIIYIILAVGVLGAIGVFVYALRAPKTAEKPAEVFSINEAEKVIYEYAKRVQRGGPPTDPDFDAELNKWIADSLSDILTPEAAKIVKNPGIYRRTMSSPSPWDIEIVSSNKISETKVKFETKHFEIAAQEIIAFYSTTFIVVKQRDKYLIDDIVIGKRVEL